VRAYADFAAGAAVFTTPGDADEHLSTMFPPVRPRGHYLEVRFLDVQPTSAGERVVSVLANLLYDDDLRRCWLRRLRPEQGQLADHWRAASLGELDVLDELGRVAA
jgi:glutamate--cysteine ligase